MVCALPLAARAADGNQSGVPVTVATATRQDVPVYLDGIGTVQAFYSVLIRARVDGTLQQFVPTEGQFVRKNDLIAVIDPRPYQAVLSGALAKKAQDEAQESNAQLDLKRYSSLAQSQFASRQQVDTQKASVSQTEAAIQGDQAAIDAAQLNLSFCYITSPVDGRVGLRLVDPGNLVHAGDQGGIVTITQQQPISVVFTLPQNQLGRISDAMANRKLPVQALSADDRNLLDTGELLTPDNAIDPATGTIRLKATFPNTAGRLWPGQFVEARLLVDTKHDAVTVPGIAIQHGPDALFVYVVRPDQTVARQNVTVAQRTNGVAAIASGLSAGDMVVVSGQSRLQTGTKVAVNTDAQPAAAGTADAASASGG
ncbi:MAG: efflux RND transporter periplasmic adaptor subunit [Acetobacteraceae bacterium]|nr:efflux RND transporter periplasmic adaptor subunit [Acetobacteraceae bacterium]